MTTNVKIATVNQTKVEAVKNVFEMYFGKVCIEGFKAESNVPEQPFNEEVKEGARNRIRDIKKRFPNSNTDFWVGIEGGIIQMGECYFNMQIVCIEDSNGKQSFGLSQGFLIPPHLLKEVRKTNLAQTMDRIFENHGGVRQLTHGLETRYDLIKEGVIMALSSFMNSNSEWHL